MIGAIGEQLGENRAARRRLRDSPNPFSRFDFGLQAPATGRPGSAADMKLFQHKDLGLLFLEKLRWRYKIFRLMLCVARGSHLTQSGRVAC